MDAVETYLKMELKKNGTLLQANMEQVSFFRTMQQFFDWLICWTLQVMLFCGPVIFLIMCAVPYLRILALIYLLWMFYDRETPHKGGRRIKSLRKLELWKYRRDYFPIKLVKTAELPPDTTYVIGNFPHGMWVIGSSTNFLSDVNHFDELFPGLTPHMHMENEAFILPFTREILISFGACGVSPDSIQHVLNGPAGNVSVITVGGFADVMRSFPGTNRIYLKKRKGFVKMALKSGSSLVPSYTFGETDTYDQMSYKWYLKLQQLLRHINVRGRRGGFILATGPFKLSYLFGMLPYQRPMTTVVGRPIKLPKVEDPSKELVDKYHEIFMQEMTSLFDEHKVKYDSQREKAILSIE